MRQMHLRIIFDGVAHYLDGESVVLRLSVRVWIVKDVQAILRTSDNENAHPKSVSDILMFSNAIWKRGASKRCQ